MRSTQHASNNAVIESGPGQPRKVLAITRVILEDADNQPAVRSYWRPSAEEIELLRQGALVVLSVLGDHQPAAFVYVEK